MAKAKKTIWVCSDCGYESSGWLGKCPACNEWNTFYEEKDIDKKGVPLKKETKEIKYVKLNDAISSNEKRIKSGYQELDRVLGGGFVEGSLILLGGEPGIGKSTLILQICNLYETDKNILYVSGEESSEQIKGRADRLKVHKDNILFLGETEIENIESAIEKVKPTLVVLDSIQTLYSDEITSAPGSVSQVREITSRIMRICKDKNITTILIGHVTKDGTIAGPRVLEHMVDTVLYLEGERYFSYRILRTVKNRFGSTNEIGMFEMQNEGLVEVKNPSAILVEDRDEDTIGTIIAPSLEGTRSILVEIQALTTKTLFGMPRRTATGIEYNRLNLLIAVLEKYTGMPLSAQDVYLNIVGGIKINEPAIDLPIILSIAASFKKYSIPFETMAIGEVGLTGELRAVNMIEKRIKEAEKMGCKKIIVPLSNKKRIKEKFNLEIVGVKNIYSAIKEIGI